MTQKQMLREQRELARLEKQRSRPKGKHYMHTLVLILCIIYVVDNMATGLSGTVQSNVINEFYVEGKGLEFNVGLSQFTTVMLLFNVLSLIGPFYKALSDRYGRKPFLVINTAGMGVGLILTGISVNLTMHMVGCAVTLFFIAHDMQMTYLAETCDPKKRATLRGVCGLIANVGLIIMPVLRAVFMGDDGTKWRNIFWVPALAAFAVSIITHFTARETDVFLNSRIAYLKTPEEQRKEKAGNKTGIPAGFRYIFRHRQTMMLMIASCVAYLSVVPITQYYESIMSTNGMAVEQVTQALFIYPFTSAIFTGINGFLSDAIGRKKAVVVNRLLCAGAFLLFILGTVMAWSPYLVGALCGTFVSCYWTSSDNITLMISESCPTGLRSSVSSAASLPMLLCYALSYVIAIVMLGASSNLGMTCFWASVPFLLIGTILLMIGTKETNGVDLETIED